MPYLIYKAMFPSGKSYIGLTSQSLRCRKHQHYCTAETKQKLSEIHKKMGQSEPHKQNRLAAIQKKVICSDGTVFPSISHAANAFGAITYSIKHGYPRSGITFAFEGGSI